MVWKSVICLVPHLGATHVTWTTLPTGRIIFHSGLRSVDHTNKNVLCNSVTSYIFLLLTVRENGGKEGPHTKTDERTVLIQFVIFIFYTKYQKVWIERVNQREFLTLNTGDENLRRQRKKECVYSFQTSVPFPPPTYKKVTAERK